MEDLERAFVLIQENQDKADFCGPRPLTTVLAGEEALGVKFPPTYRAFLIQLGCGDIAGEEFYGLVDDDFVNSSVPDAIWVTLSNRKQSEQFGIEYPKSFVVVGVTGDGGDYIIDLSDCADGEEGPVLEWWPLPDQHAKVADDFGQFLFESIRKALAYDD